MTPLLLMAVGALLILLAARLLVHQRRTVELMPHSNTSIVVPSSWDQDFIGDQLMRHRDQPWVLTHYLSSVRDRFIVNQEDKTARVRTRFLQAKIEQLKLAKELQLAVYDLQLLGTEQEIRALRLENEKEQLQYDSTNQRRLRQLERERDELRIKLETAQLQQQMDSLTAKPIPKPTSAQLRQEKRQEIEGDIERLEGEKARLMSKAKSEEEKRRQENRIDERLEELRDQLLRHL